MLQLSMTKQQIFSKKNSLEPCPNFTNILALQKHVIKAQSQLFCLQSAIHGWLGLAMEPATYLLLEGVAFVTPNDPGPMPVYPQWASPTTIKMIDVTFVREKNYFSSVKNIVQECFRMFNEKVGAQFKVSNTPTFTGPEPTPGFVGQAQHDDVV
jgi:hypothetical protein